MNMKAPDKTKQDPLKISAIEIKPPTGGGTIKGLGDLFKADPFTGTGTYAIPIPVTAARGFEPDLNLSYNSGGVNGPFGLGFSLMLSKISVNSNKRIPRYNGTDQYLLDGNVLSAKSATAQQPNPRTATVNDITYQVTTYLTSPGIDFSLIEKWTAADTGLSFWKIVTPDNITTVYGEDDTSRVANPDDGTQIYEWLPCQSYDAKGNRIVYDYLKENNDNVPDSVYEINHNWKAGRYLNTVSYGNYQRPDKTEAFAFSIVFNYGQDATHQWPCRPDPFSYYNAGFEIRVFRLCEKIQLVHHFPDELGDPLVVKELVLQYEDVQSYTNVQFQAPSLLKSIVMNGYRKELTAPQPAPPLELGFSSFQPPVAPQFKILETDTSSIPGYLDTTGFLPVDLNRDGLPGFLYSNNTSCLYMAPLGDGRYQAPQENSSFPINKNLQRGEAVLTDIDGNGMLDLLVNAPGEMGYYPRNADGGWNNYTPFPNFPNNFHDPHMEMADLDANGKTDLLIANTGSLQIFNSLGLDGYATPTFITNTNGFPLVKTGYQQEMVTFADMFGDGLPHRVKISSGMVECWPCLGYGRFGKKITMGNPPQFNDDFDNARLFLTDTDGSGTADLVYVYPDRVELFLNQSGNTFSAPVTIHLPETFGILDRISFADILGNGTNCLVFTKISPVPKQYYYNFSGEVTLPDGTSTPSLKPYLLNVINNNLGGIQIISYCSAVKFALADKQAGQPWVTKLPFPVQVVEQITVYESFSQSRYVSRYSYHNGYYDAYTRSFKGFGMTETWDAETYESFQQSYQNPDYPVSALNQELFVPPVHTKYWFLNGCGPLAYYPLLAQFRTQYFQGDPQAYNFPDSQLPEGMDIVTTNTAYLSLAGQMIRKEVYADDDTAMAADPYQVIQTNYEVTLIQAAVPDNPAVFQVDTREVITYDYERDPQDPRVQQEFILETDPACGQPELSCIIYLPRRNQPKTYPEQYVQKGTISRNQYYDSPDDADYWLKGIPCQLQEYQLLNATCNGNYYSFEEAQSQVQDALKQVIPYLGTAPAAICAMLYSDTTTYFWDAAQQQALPAGQVTARALVHHIATAAFTNDNISSAFGDRLSADTISSLGGYAYNAASGYWENAGLIQQYYSTPESFYQASGTSSSAASLGAMATVSYDNYYLVAVNTSSYLSTDPAVVNVVSAVADYQNLQLKQIVDINDNVSQFLFDALGQLIVSTRYGRQTDGLTGGMLLYNYQQQKAEYVLRTTAPDHGPITFDSILQDEDYYLQGATSFFYYNLDGPLQNNQPLSAINLIRENYYYQGGNTVSASPVQTSVSYNDGLLRIMEKKTKATPVPEAADKWLVSDRKVFNNKGKACETYASFFSDTPDYETQDQITSLYKVPPPVITHYDPLGRIIRVDTSKGFYTKTEFSSWEKAVFDEDDTVITSVYYQQFMANYPPEPTQQEIDEKDALDKAARFNNTPMLQILDNMAHTIRTIATLENGMQPPAFIATDISGRKLCEIDPRLYASNVNSGTNYYNFRYQYPMGSETPQLIDSADAGTQKHFNNIFDLQTWSFSARSYCQVIFYDWLQRKLQLKIKLITTTGPVSSFDNFSLVEQYTYGEYATQPAGSNLRGEAYQLNDLSGVLLTTAFSLTGNLMATSRQMAKEYKTPVNWNKTVALQDKIYAFSYTFNAVSKQLTQTAPDNSVVSYSYNYQGLLTAVNLKTSEGTATAVVKSISYNAANLRTAITYGNNTNTVFTYEDTTNRLIRLLTLRTGQQPATMQDIAYTYDPVGNSTRTRDNSIEVIFSNNQQVDPLQDYNYNALYQLTTASGRQHPGINATTYRNNIADGSFMQSKFSQTPVNDGSAIENYRELYTYDDSGNLTKKQHIATSANWTQDTPVMDSCNHLNDVTYDEAGNPLYVQINDHVQLVFNCCNNLTSVPVITRPDEPDDADYYVYDSEEQRTRKVSELYATASSVTYNDTIYFNNYLYLEKGTQLSDGSRTSTDQRQSIRVMDDKDCVLIYHYWTQGGPQGGDHTQYRYQLDNNQQSVSVELDQDGLLISYEEYYPYGGTSIIAGSNQVDVSQKIYRYSGKECDNATGFYYYGQRYYVSWLGRWLNPDPAGTIDGWNLYAFVKGNPVTNVDEEGLAARNAWQRLRPGGMGSSWMRAGNPALTTAAALTGGPRATLTSRATTVAKAGSGSGSGSGSGAAAAAGAGSGSGGGSGSGSAGSVRNYSSSSSASSAAAAAASSSSAVITPADLSNPDYSVGASAAVSLQSGLVHTPSLVYCRAGVISVFGIGGFYLSSVVFHFEGTPDAMHEALRSALVRPSGSYLKVMAGTSGNDSLVPNTPHVNRGMPMDPLTVKLLSDLQPDLGAQWHAATKITDAQTAAFRSKYDNRSIMQRAAETLGGFGIQRRTGIFRISPAGIVSSAGLSQHMIEQLLKKPMD
ncbi:SpvB/TcaC N-terminal domain-containing protein [Chitinophaga solisilvae]|uniref:SpvB/TcaC N-terminal domain-containing protein n=1 Tax=Chitinophaga solisilvae TaxID=1233460 RepID=UPI001370602B|nr:SpvB/TcaC N-terminal domain-containing protein [Chitinophaga solisilvae]